MATTLLYATDFSPSADNAFPHALTLGLLFRARLVLLHVRTPLRDDLSQSAVYFDSTEAMHREAERVTGQLLDRRLAEAAPLTSVSRVVRGRLADEGVLDAVAEEGADWVVMGTHGRRGLDQFIMGSTALAVAKKSPVPVVTVREDVPAPDPEQPYKRILVPVDLSPGSERAVRSAWEMAQVTRGSLLVLHVGRREGDHARVQAAMEALVRDCDPARVETLALPGQPEEIILQEARRMPADLVWMAKKGQSLLEYVLLGSVTERVIRLAPCPVVAVPAQSAG
jgi:nucleotide-binding universal stress UspA family protein